MIACQLIGAPLAYLAMGRSAWFTISLGLFCLIASFIGSLISSETLGIKTRTPPARGDSTCNESLPGTGNDTAGGSHHRLEVITLIKEARESLCQLFGENKRLGLFLVTVLFTNLGTYMPLMTLMLNQYATKKFPWSWSEAGLLSSVSAGVKLLLILVILPRLSRVMLYKFALTPLSKNLIIVRSSIVFLIAGTFTIGVASHPSMLLAGLVVHALGWGYGPALRDLLALLTRDDQIGLLFTVMGILDNIGMLIAGPLMTAAFRLGLAWGVPGLGYHSLPQHTCLQARQRFYLVYASKRKGEYSMDARRPLR
ncbi:MFS transporter [Penicillium herquei]|nr:MFS transporter [Penicillium herquei]